MDDEDGLRYRKLRGLGFGFGLASASLRSEVGRVSELRGELYTLLVVAVPPGKGRRTVMVWVGR